jgi:hypothetical protein
MPENYVSQIFSKISILSNSIAGDSKSGPSDSAFWRCLHIKLQLMPEILAGVNTRIEFHYRGKWTRHHDSPIGFVICLALEKNL